MVTRVLWVSKGLGPGGAERLLVEAAAAIDPTEFDVEALYVLPWKDHIAGELETLGVRATCLSTRRRDPLWPWRLRTAMDGVDVVHSHSPVPAVAARIASLTMPRSRRPALMTTEHNSWASHRRPTRWANRLTGGLDRATFAVTDEAAESLSGHAARRVVVLQHGVDVAAIAERERDVGAMRASLRIGAEEVLIGTVANLRPQKDYPNLLAAARRMVDDGVQFRIVAVGQGPDEQAVIQQRDELGLEDHVVLAGFRSDAVDVMSACDIFVLASAWEGLPVAVMEALSLGLPIVATRVGGVAESLDDGCAVLVPPRDPAALAAALTALVDDPERRAALSAGARSIAECFDARRALATITDRYRELASPAPAGEPEIAPAAPTAPRRPQGEKLSIRPMSDSDLEPVLSLLGSSLGWENDERSRRLFEWKHRTNPFGESLGFVAESGGDIIAVRLFMRWRFRRGGETLDAVRAIDTATHPDFQGRGLFTSLTMHALDAARDDGVAFVFNTPNSQSRPGYLKMGWRDVGRPSVAFRPTSPGSIVSIAHSRVPADRWSTPIDVGADINTWLTRTPSAAILPAVVSSTDRTLRTDRCEAFLRWRYGLDDLHYRVIEGEDTSVIVRLRQRGASRELVAADSFGSRSAADRLASEVGRSVGATHVIRLGPPDPRRGFIPMPGIGPDLTWRAVNDRGQPPLSNWDLRLGDVELF